MSDLLLAFILFAVDEPGRGGGTDTAGGLGIIFAVLGLVVLAIAVVWTIAARRGSRVPDREPQPPGSVGS